MCLFVTVLYLDRKAYGRNNPVAAGGGGQGGQLPPGAGTRGAPAKAN